MLITEITKGGIKILTIRITLFLTIQGIANTTTRTMEEETGTIIESKMSFRKISWQQY